MASRKGIVEIFLSMSSLVNIVSFFSVRSKESAASLCWMFSTLVRVPVFFMHLTPAISSGWSCSDLMNGLITCNTWSLHILLCFACLMSNISPWKSSICFLINDLFLSVCDKLDVSSKWLVNEFFFCWRYFFCLRKHILSCKEVRNGATSSSTWLTTSPDGCSFSGLSIFKCLRASIPRSNTLVSFPSFSHLSHSSPLSIETVCLSLRSSFYLFWTSKNSWVRLHTR